MLLTTNLYARLILLNIQVRENKLSQKKLNLRNEKFSISHKNYMPFIDYWKF